MNESCNLRPLWQRMPSNRRQRNLPASLRPAPAAVLEVRPLRGLRRLPQSGHVGQQPRRHKAARYCGRRRTQTAAPTGSWSDRPVMAKSKAAGARSASRVQSAHKYRPSSWVRRYWNVVPFVALVCLSGAFLFAGKTADSEPSASHYTPMKRHPIGEWKTNCPKPYGMNPDWCHGPTR